MSKKAKQYTFVPEKGIAYITSDLIIRAGFPSIEGEALETVASGTALKYIGYITDGYNVGGRNSLWYVMEGGDFFWSGNTTTKEPKNKSATPDEKVLHSPLKKLICTQRFGERPEVYKNYGSPKGHNGIDFRTRKSNDWNDWKQDVFTVLGGEVTEATENQWNGKFVRIAHSNEYESVYLHLSQIDVKKGQQIKAGAKIGISGNSGGASEAPHLHFGYRPIKYDKNNGRMGYIDPAPYFIDEITYLS